MSDDFELMIHLGNSAMLTPGNVADALESVAARIRRGDYWPGHTQLIRDSNGSRVGGYRFPVGTASDGTAGHWDAEPMPDIGPEYSEARERSDLASGDAAERTFYSPGGLSETWHASKRCSGRQGLTRTMSDREAFERLALCRKCCSAILDRHWLPASQRARQASPVHPV